MTAQFNPDVRDLYEEIVKRNVIHNPRDNFDYMPERYGGSRVRDIALSGNDGHFPSNDQIIHSNMGGFYGRASHPIAVGSGRYERQCGGVGILKQARVEPFVNELDMDYMPVSASHGAGRAPRLTNKIKQMILEQHPELMQHHLAGGAIDWGKIWKGIKNVGSFVSKAAPVLSSIAPEEYRDTINKTGDISGKISGLGRTPRAPRITNAIKNRIMAQHPEIRAHVMSGGAVNWSKLWGQIKSGLNVVSKVAPVISSLAPEEYRDTINKTGDISGKISGLGRGGNFAHMAAIDLARRAMSKKKGAGFWKDFGTGFKQGFKQTAKYAAPALGVASIFQPELLPLAAATGVASKALGNGRRRMTLPKSGHKREVTRGLIVGDIMRKYGMSLPEASKYVKANNLY
jgi:hypothetical protein